MNRVSRIVNLQEAHRRGIKGRGVGIAVLDTGISPHKDFIFPEMRVSGFYDVLHKMRKPYDDNGHGTHVSGIIAGSGYASGGRYVGMAPHANLIPVKVLGNKGDGGTNEVIQGLDYVMRNRWRYHIDIVNISIGSVRGSEYEEDSEFIRKVNETWDSGIVVVAAAGNGGPKKGTIGAPGNSRKVITVGSSDSSASFSAAGPTNACVKKPDVVAPGHNIYSCNKAEYYRIPYVPKSGTSMSTPVVSGAIALLLSTYPDMSPLQVKVRLKNAAVDMSQPHERQGWGQLDVKRLLDLP